MTVKKPASWVNLDATHIDPKRIAKERAKARALKATAWWKQKIARGICEHCQKKIRPAELTMDHLRPLAQGGTSSRNNLVASCLACNQAKGLTDPIEAAFAEIQKGNTS